MIYEARSPQPNHEGNDKDGHAGPVQLRQLWTLDWHNNWAAPANLPAPK